MKVLMLHNRYLVPGGEDRSTAAEAALLTDYGHQVELLEHDNREIKSLGKAKTAARTLWSPDSYHRVYSKLRDGQFDVMHVQNFFPLWSPSVYYAAAKCGIPVVQTLRNYRLMCVNYSFFRDGHVCEDCLGRFMPWSGIIHACYKDSRMASSVVAAMIGLHKMMGTWANRVDIYVALTEFAREKYIAGGLPAERIVVKPNFVHPSPLAGQGGGEYAVFVGRLSPEKGISTLLEAWKSPKIVLPLRIIGEGPLENSVRAAAATCHQIQYMGSRSPVQVLDAMRQAEFLVFPSEWYEGMPRVVIEAFAVGTPVIASNIGAAASMVVPGRNGLHFPPGDVATLRQLLESHACNLSELRAMRRGARLSFESHYTGQANADLLLSVYRKARQQRHAGATQKT
jgi:glycosyltransferase involved in cell wall biosynthesis